MPISKQLRKLLPAIAAACVLALLAACTIQTKENHGDKGNKDVKIETPWGGLSVRTDPDIKDTGLPLYPGAQRKPGSDNDRHAANVDISTPVFGLKVVAIEFVSQDAPDRVLAFYRDKMKGFGGKFLECTGTSYVNIDNQGGGFSADDSGDGKDLTCGKRHGEATELKAGTPGNQHVVAVKHAGQGSEFALVYVQKHGKEGNI